VFLRFVVYFAGDDVRDLCAVAFHLVTLAIGDGMKQSGDIGQVLPMPRCFRGLRSTPTRVF
jgi:hypothetical protein